MEPNEPKEPGGEVVSLDEARRKVGERAAGDADAPPTVNVNASEFFRPVMAAIARELESVADPDGEQRAGGSAEAERAKTAAVVKGLGLGLGQALAEAFGRWAQRIESGQGLPATVTPIAVERGDGDDPDEKKPS
jgi:hypothetical protein